MSTVSIHLANTVGGEYDVKWPLPKPLHCDRFSGEITRPVPGNDFDHVIGFTADLASFVIDFTWSEWVTEPLDPKLVVGMFPVVIEDGKFATLPLPIRQVSVDGKPLEMATAQ